MARGGILTVLLMVACSGVCRAAVQNVPDAPSGICGCFSLIFSETLLLPSHPVHDPQKER